jgi:hypothetical protein
MLIKKIKFLLYNIFKKYNNKFCQWAVNKLMVVRSFNDIGIKNWIVWSISIPHSQKAPGFKVKNYTFICKMHTQDIEMTSKQINI